LDILAQAYLQLRDEGLPIQLYLVGDGPYLQALHEAMPEAIFTGYLRGKELAAAYASADVFVFPSTTDTFGNVVIEAQASGVPVIVSDTGGPKELVEANVNGVVTKSHNVVAGRWYFCWRGDWRHDLAGASHCCNCRAS